ncbi:hypothetical protein RZE82_08040 [Mollicutes bacterium LVI A0039]|nr:hypothetical protein RZE82_08040 [Mollicutes bacterium LVI A0039]
MKETLKQYKQSKGTRQGKIMQSFVLVVLSLLYFYFILIWTPDTYVSILGNDQFFDYIKYGCAIILAVYTAVQLDANYFRAPKFSSKQIEDYEMWNKFFLHFAFMKTGSGSEKSQVNDVLRYLEDSELKQTLKEVYEETTTLKDAHIKIVEKYPYPQVKTFFSEAEDALVKGADGNRLMQKTALNIDKFINDLSGYEKQKQSSFKVTIALLSSVSALTLVAKLLFAEVFIDFTNTYVGLVILILFFIMINSLFVLAKRFLNRPLLTFGGGSNE